MTERPTILIVDDEKRSLESMVRILDDEFDVHTANTATEALAILEREWVQVMVCDQRMPDVSGVTLLSQVREQWPEIVRMIISGYTDSDDIISAINEAGIYQFISKPWHPDELRLKLRNAVELFELQRQNERLALELKLKPSTLSAAIQSKRAALQERYDWEMGVVRGPDSCMNAVCQEIFQVAPYDVNVVLTGESGTGKELLARALHYNSLRQNEVFIAQNCGALPDELLESELFGHKRGAFTGAIADRVGLFELADKGTIFLDEIGDISPAFQVKLLRVLQEGEIRPLGTNTTRSINVRVIAATNKDLTEEVRQGRFRQDLYYRLATFSIHLPPLRHRLQDVPYLAQALLQESMQQMGKQVKGFSKEAIACLQAYHWPGNVRELQNEVKRMLVLCQGDYLEANVVSAQVLRATPEEYRQDMRLLTDDLQGTLKDRVEQLEARILKEVLTRHRWNKSRAAEELGLSRVGLRSKLERYELERLDAAGSA
ncbi:MAG: sigma-54 dependent transcriptional regulator [Thiolinea sp.]